MRLPSSSIEFELEKEDDDSVTSLSNSLPIIDTSGLVTSSLLLVAMMNYSMIATARLAVSDIPTARPLSCFFCVSKSHA